MCVFVCVCMSCHVVTGIIIFQTDSQQPDRIQPTHSIVFDYNVFKNKTKEYIFLLISFIKLNLTFLFLPSRGDRRRASGVHQPPDAGPRQPPEHRRRADADGGVELPARRAAQPHVDHGPGLQVHQLRDSQLAA